MKTSILGVLVGVGILLFVNSGIAALSDKGGLTLSLNESGNAVVLRAPVYVELVISNELVEPREVDLGAGQKAALVLTISKDGQHEGSFRYPIVSGLSRIGWIKVGGSGQSRKRILLNEWYDFAVPGKYQIQVAANLRMRSESVVSSVGVESNTIVLDVLPYESSKLDAACRSLRDIALGSDGAEAASEATLALSLVRDPIAVPYLEEVFRNGLFAKSIAADGLQKIRNAAAVNALVQALRDNRDETADISRSVLQRLMTMGIPEELKSAISSALAAK